MSDENSNKTDWVTLLFKPEIGKRFRYTAYQFASFFHFFTMIFVQSGLIDRNHPCTRSANIGKYSFRDILGVAYSGIKWKKAYIPQILMFFAVIAAVIFMFLIVAALLVKFVLNTGAAYAQQTASQFDGQSAFSNPVQNASRQTDIVHNLLTNIFGDTGMHYFADPSTSTPESYKATWLHDALTAALSYYSIAMMVIAVFIICYYLASVLLETTADGKPFGDRFNVVWAPVRFVICLALLAPISNGYNMAQLIVFQAADWGGGFASNIWARGLEAFGDQRVVGTPEPNKGVKFVRAFWLSSVCMEAWNQYADKHSGTLAYEGMKISTTRESERIEAGNQEKMKSMIYSFGNSTDPDFCGALRVPLMNDSLSGNSGILRNAGSRVLQATFQNIFTVLSSGEPGSDLSNGQGGIGTPSTSYGWGQPGDIGGVNNIAAVASGTPGTAALDAVIKGGLLSGFMSRRPIPNGGDMENGRGIPAVARKFAAIYNPEDAAYDEEDPFDNPLFVQNFQIHWMNDIYQNYLMQGISAAVEAQENAAQQLIQEGAQYGWGQAGAYFITLASMNGSMQSGVQNGLEVVKLPELLSTEDARPEGNFFSELGKAFGIILNYLSFGMLDLFLDAFGLSPLNKAEAATYTYDVLDKAELWWDQSPIVKNQEAEVDTTGEQTTGSFSPKKNEKSSWGLSPQKIMAMIMGSITKVIGGVVKWIIDALDTYNPFAMLSFIGGFLMAVGLGILIWGSVFTAAPIVGGLGYIVMAIAGTIVGAGATLYIVLPIIPYFYFTMSVINWAIGVFQAVIGMPLWALSFLKIDGQGPVPEGSMNVLIILFQIFLRPPMMIIALVGSMLVFSGAMAFLNSTYMTMFYAMVDADGIVSGNTALVAGSVAMGVGGAGKMVVVNAMGKLIMAITLLIFYVIMVYSIALVVFKMVDNIPNGIIDYFGIGKVEPITDVDETRGVRVGLHGLVAGSIMKSAVSGVVNKQKEELKAHNDKVKTDKLRENIRKEEEKKYNSLNNKNIPNNNVTGSNGPDDYSI